MIQMIKRFSVTIGVILVLIAVSFLLLIDNIGMSYTAVSYTHLDVYKRQARGWREF